MAKHVRKHIKVIVPASGDQLPSNFKNQKFHAITQRGDLTPLLNYFLAVLFSQSYCLLCQSGKQTSELRQIPTEAVVCEFNFQSISQHIPLIQQA